MYDNQKPYDGAKSLKSRSSRRFASKQISPHVSGDNLEVGQVSYRFNFLKSRGPRRMHCSIQCPVGQGTASDPSKEKPPSTSSSLSLKNKAPRWHDHLQCWCLNFHGRVTVASVKNFQLVAPAGTSDPWGVGDEETVILQFGKIGTMLSRWTSGIPCRPTRRSPSVSPALARSWLVNKCYSVDVIV